MQRPFTEFDPTLGDRLVQINPSAEMLEILQLIALGNLPSQNAISLDKVRNIGIPLSTYFRFMRDSANEFDGREVGTYLALGNRQKNLGLIYADNKLERGMAGRADRVKPAKDDVLREYNVVTRGRSHTHPGNPPWHHHGDTWVITYNSQKVTKFLNGGTIEFEAIITPDNLGLIIATEEARNFFNRGGISYRNLEQEFVKEINRIADKNEWSRRTTPDLTISMKKRANMILMTRWYMQQGMALFASSNTDETDIRLERLEPSGSGEEYLTKLGRMNLLGEPLSRYSGLK